MGPLGDGEKPCESSSENSADSYEFETQLVDSQCSPCDDIENEGSDDCLYLTNTIPIDDDYLLEDDFETQLVNLAGETQVVDISGETEVWDDLDFVKDLDVEFSSGGNAKGTGSPCSGTNKTVDLFGIQDDSQDDTVIIDCDDSHGVVSTPKPSSAEPVSLSKGTHEEHHNGSIPGGFTSIRAASIRASGLAARAQATNSNLCTSSCGKSSLEQQRYKQDGSSPVSNGQNNGDGLQKCYDEGEHRISSRCKVASTAMRKLFREDEVDQSEANLDQLGDDLDPPGSPNSQNCLAGLSYANSQEPGDLSQANALEFVDKFLELNAPEYNNGHGIRVLEKSIVFSGAKGSLNLAKSSNLKSTDGGPRIYEWDGTREDSCGGEFFQKNKELFFGMRDSKQGSLMKPRKSRRPDVQTAEALGCNRDKKEQNNAHNTLGDTVSSDSRLLHKVNSEDKSLHPGEKELCKNPAKNLNDQENRMSETEENDTLKNMPDVKDIGPDTQIAAEAMETLCFEVHLADNNDNHPNKETSNLVKANTRTRSSNKSAHLQECPTTDLLCPTSVGGGRQAKRKTRAGNASSEPLPKESKQTRTRCNTVLEQAAPRSKDEMSVSPCHANESAGKRSALKSGTKETLLSTPVAHRTRNSTDLKQPKPAINSFDVHEEIKELLSAPVQRKKRTPRKHKNVKMVTIEQLKKIRLAALDQAKKTYLDKSNAPNIEGVTNDQGKRPRRETTVEQEADEEYSRNFKRPREVEKRNTEVPSAKGANINCEQGASPKEKYRTPVFSRGTPGDCATPVKNVSPVCMGDEYHKQSRLKNISRHSLIKEINSLVTDSPGKDLRKRKDITNVKILFSQHLHEDVIKQQKKILSRVKGTVASSMSDATHFVADEFVRTRNMLEAIASGKPVVTHLWLESCGQANCLIDEKTYILRDARKEREFGFSLPVSLARAVRHPLLQGHRVFVTPNTKPGRDILANLVNAVHGVVIERLGRSIFKDDKLPDDLLILSCEEDYDICVPFLEKDGLVYSSELLLNGILKQKLEYERHRLFANKIRRTRSTTWVKKKNQYCPVTKGK